MPLRPADRCASKGCPAFSIRLSLTGKEIFDYRSYCRGGVELQNRFVSRLLEHGIRITERGVWFLSLAHSERDIDRTLEATRAALLSL